MAKHGHHNPKHNTTRSGSTKDTRPKGAQKQIDRAMDTTGANNEVQKLNSNTDRGQTLGNGPWGTSMGHELGTNVDPWQDK